MRRLVWPAVLVLTTMAVLVLGVFPTRTWLNQRRTISAAEAHLSQLEQANAQASAHAATLQTPAEVERLARLEFGYAKPGEEVYRILPPPQDPVAVPSSWPFERLGSTRER